VVILQKTSPIKCVVVIYEDGPATPLCSAVRCTATQVGWADPPRQRESLSKESHDTCDPKCRARELYVANGFEFPGEQAVASFGSFDYLTAEMTAR
jgi:hypothetical protein